VNHLSKKKVKTSGSIVQDFVNVWTSITDKEKIRYEVKRWTRRKPATEKQVLA